MTATVVAPASPAATDWSAPKLPALDGERGHSPEQTVITARVVEVEGLLARVATLLNPYDVRELNLSLDKGTLRVVVEGKGFDATRVAARLEKIIGVLDIRRLQP